MQLIHTTMNQDYCISMGPFGYSTEEICRITVLRGYARIQVEVEVARVKGTSFGKELLQETELRKGRPCNDKPLFDLIYQKCLPFLENLAPRTSLHDVSLEAFLHSPSYNLELTQGESDEDVLLYFKPRMELREAEFERELRILTRINEAGLTARLRVPKLQGVVVSGEDTIGMLMTLITSSSMATHLRSAGLQARHELHGQWEEQLIATVQELHGHGIVWGDVHPMNVVIDEDMNAWAIDFGGMNNAEFVDDEKRETVEGDRQGLTRLFQQWLPAARRVSQ
jgi:serine/threonine protein kinase